MTRAKEHPAYYADWLSTGTRRRLMSERNEKATNKTKSSRSDELSDVGIETRLGTRGVEKSQEQGAQEKKHPFEKKEVKPRAKVGPFGYIGVTREGGEKRRFIAHVLVG